MTGLPAKTRSRGRRSDELPDGVARLDAEAPTAVAVATVLATNPEVEIAVRGPAVLAGDPHQPADARPVDRDERVRRDELSLLVHAQELADVIARESEGGLRQVVRPEREEVADLGDL